MSCPVHVLNREVYGWHAMLSESPCQEEGMAHGVGWGGGLCMLQEKLPCSLPGVLGWGGGGYAAMRGDIEQAQPGRWCGRQKAKERLLFWRIHTDNNNNNRGRETFS